MKQTKEAMPILGDHVTFEEAARFEVLCKYVLELEGFDRVTIVGGAKDEGTDIIAYQDDQMWSIQCKCWNGCVSSAAVRDAYGGAGSRKQDQSTDCKAMLIVNGTVSSDARNQAEKLGVVIRDGNWLRKRIPMPVNTEETLLYGHRYQVTGQMELKMNEITILYKTEEEYPRLPDYVVMIETKTASGLSKFIPVIVNGKMRIRIEDKVVLLEDLYREYPFGEMFLVNIIAKTVKTGQGPVLQAEMLSIA